MSGTSVDNEPIYILDRVVVKPGMATAYRDAYLENYAPSAERRGMRLVSVLASPPLDVAGEPTTILILWSVDGVAAWWDMRIGRGPGQLPDPSGRGRSAWWEESDEMVVERSRSVLADFRTGANDRFTPGPGQP